MQPINNSKTATNEKSQLCRQENPPRGAPVLSSLRSNSGTSCRSNIIPLPPSHISRTPSELQLADNKLRADYEDVRMYSRLVGGMQSQMTRNFHTNGGMVHPLSRGALHGIVKTKMAKDDELLEKKDNDWAMSHAKDVEKVENPSNFGSTDGSLSTTYGSSKKTVQGEEENDDDECVFSLEL